MTAPGLTPVHLTPQADGSAVDDATVLAAWAIVRAAALRTSALVVPVTAGDRAGAVRVDLDAASTGDDLRAVCAAGIAAPDTAAPAAPLDDITVVLTPERPPQVALRYRTPGADPVQVTLLAGLLARTAERLSRVPSAPLAELRRLTGDQPQPPAAWRHAAEAPTAAEPPPERHRVIRERALREPHRTAVIHGAQRLTYGELDQRANQLANLLVAHGVGPDIPVAVCLPAGLDLVVSMLAVLKAGGCYLPMDPGNPAARTAFLLDDAAVRVVLAGDGVPITTDQPRPVIRLDTPAGRELIAGYPQDPPAEPADPRRLGYILYTSGSTGEPKGVAVPEDAVGRLLRTVGRYVSLEPGDAALFSSSPAFDISTVEIFLPLLSGAQVVVADRDQTRTPKEVVRLIDQHRVRLAQATPSAWRPLTDALAAGGRREWLQAITAGEPLTPDLAGRLLAVAGRVLNGYGPTETTIYSTIATITTLDEVTVGEPVDGTTLYVVDEHDRPVPAGVPGELLIGGRSVARGYLNRPQLTAERFVPDTWQETGGADPAEPATVYRTGDLAWWAPDGRLRVLGRIDTQVKVRGYRIEPGEVEARLDSHPDITASVVRAREFGPGDTRLVAYLVTAGDRPLTLGELRDWCAATLPDYLIPTVCVTLPRLPLNGSGKLDDPALPDAAAILAGQAAEPRCDEARRAGPRTAAERAVARIWQRALWADDLDVHDDFFDLGGDSLLATQVTQELEREFVLDVPIQAIFRYPTVAELAAALVKARTTGRVDVSAAPYSATAPAGAAGARTEQAPANG
jgi:amino acid adenylation domain-containing protein